MRVQVALEAHNKREADAAAAAAQANILQLNSALEDKAGQLDLQFSRSEALRADLDRASQALQAKHAELLDTQAQLQARGWLVTCVLLACLTLSAPCRMFRTPWWGCSKSLLLSCSLRMMRRRPCRRRWGGSK
jgi:hypothetical protein